MRLMHRPLLLALAFASLSCAEQTSSVQPSGHNTGRVALAPMFEPAAARAYQMLVATGTSVVSIRVVLMNLAGKAVVDTIVAFPATQDTVAVDLPVPISGQQEQFDSVIELRDASGAVQFASRQRITVRTSGASSPLPVSMQYVGPGASASRITLSPSAITLPSGTPQSLIATGTDAAGKSVGDLSVTWTSSDTAIAVVTASGNTTANVTPRGKRGLVVISATAPSGITGAAQITYLPQPGRLVVISGDAQTGVANKTLPNPFVVELQGTDGKPIVGRLVTFAATTPGGVVGVVTQSTDSLGRARTSIKPGRTAGTYTFSATFGTLPTVSISATATPAPVGPPTQIIALSPVPKSFTVGVAPLSNFSAQLADANGNYVLTAGVTITATLVVQPGGGTTTASASTDALGVFVLTIPPYIGPSGSVTISLSSPTIPNLPSGTFPILPGAPVKLVVTQQPPATTTSGAALATAPIVSLADLANNPTSGGGIVITASATGGNVSLSGTITATTAANGTATFTHLALNGPSGTYGLTFSASGYGTVASSSIRIP